MNDQFLTVSQFHERFSNVMSKVGIYQAISRGDLKHIRVGKKILIDLPAFLEGRKKAAPVVAPPMEKGAWTIDEASQWSTLSKAVVRRAAHDKRFPAHRSGKGWVIPREPFQAWFNRGDCYTTIDNEERQTLRQKHGWTIPPSTTRSREPKAS